MPGRSPRRHVQAAVANQRTRPDRPRRETGYMTGYLARLDAKETTGTRLDQIDRRLAVVEAEIARAHRRIDDLEANR